ncbi:hypothetical protein [Neobacillus piezotolerans]|uniref:hypothetical protein n=1 Tax=Neobacillus piezotolerans TaxID=2259171 RepID=UPI0015F16501|nr:hypothetical protein [Neobacillus piezotolerans]
MKIGKTRTHREQVLHSGKNGLRAKLLAYPLIYQYFKIGKPFPLKKLTFLAEIGESAAVLAKRVKVCVL